MRTYVFASWAACGGWALLLGGFAGIWPWPVSLGLTVAWLCLIAFLWWRR